MKYIFTLSFALIFMIGLNAQSSYKSIRGVDAKTYFKDMFHNISEDALSSSNAQADNELEVVEYHYYDMLSSSWMNEEKEEYSYTNQLLTEWSLSSWDTTGLAWLNYAKISIDYGGDMYPDEAIFSFYEPDLMIWMDMMKFTMMWNGDNQITEETDYEWDLIGNAWKATYRIVHSYDGNKRITAETEQTSDDGTTWVNVYQSTYSYPSATEMTEAWQEWIGGAWEDQSKSEYTLNTEGNPTVEILSNWDGSQWQTSDKTEYEYDSSDRLTKERYFNWNGSMYIESNYSDYAYDGNGNFTLNTYGNTNGDPSGKYENAYNMNYEIENLVVPSELFEIWENPEHIFNMLVDETEYVYSDGAWQMDSRRVYTYTDMSEPTSIEEQETNVSVYPNPSNGMVQFSFEANQATLLVYDFNGKTVVNTAVRNNELVDLNSLESGLYFYSLQINDEIVSGKLMMK